MTLHAFTGVMQWFTWFFTLSFEWYPKARVSETTKIGIIKNLIPKFDNIIVVGGMANNILNYLGRPIGKSIKEDNCETIIDNIFETAKNHSIQKDEPWISIHHDLELSSEHLHRLRDCLKISDQTSGDFQRLITTIT